jgi:hypothetical protein
MTVSSTASRVVLAGDGSNTVWPFAFKVQQPADLVVVYTDATGTDVTLSTGQYDATGIGQDAGGTVTYPASGSGNPAIAPGTTLTIYRNVAVTQPTSISNQGAMWPQVIEAALDRLTFIGQAASDAIGRALVISPTDGGALALLPAKALRANAVLGFDANGQPYAAQGLTGGGSASSWLIANFLPMTSAAAARGAIGAAGLADNNAFSGTNSFVTPGAGDDSTKAATTAYADRAAANATSAYVIRSYLAGLGIANDGGAPTTKLDVAAGVCADDGNAAMLALAAGTVDCTTTGANALDAGSLAASTWYHLFAIGRPDGTTARLASTSLSSPALPAGYTLKRRIGSFRTDGSAHIVPFVQVGDRFLWTAEVADQAGTSLSAATQLLTLGVPTGLSVEALFNAATASGSDVRWLFSSPLQASVSYAQGHTNAQGVAGSSGNGGSGQFRVVTDTAARVRVVANATVSPFYLFTTGWLDRRGRDS